MQHSPIGAVNKRSDLGSIIKIGEIERKSRTFSEFQKKRITPTPSSIEAQCLRCIDFSLESKESAKPNQKITSLKGLEAFEKLEILKLKNQFVKSVNSIYHLNQLNVLNLSNNDIYAIDLSGMPMLDSLNLGGNSRITSLDFHNNKALSFILLNGSNIKSIDISNLSNLKTFFMNKCGLERIRLGRHDHMTYIDLVNNDLKSFEVGDLPQIKDLQLWKNKIEKLSLGKMPKLWRLNLANNNLKEVDLSNATSLLSFFAFENPNLKQINFSKCINLKNVILSDTKIDVLDFSHNKYITSIEASNVPNLQIVNLKNDGFEKEDFEYLFIFPENKSLRKIVVDEGDEYDIVTKMVSRIVSSNPGMNIEVVTN